MPGLFRLLVLLLAVLFQLGLRGAEPTPEDAEAGPAAPSRMMAESSEDGAPERLAIDDAADENAHRISIAIRLASAAVFTRAGGLAKRSRALDTPFEPPRSSLA